MNMPLLAARNILRNKSRTALTILGVAVVVMFFMVLRTVLFSWEESIETGARDRLATRNKISFVITLPRNYLDKIRAVPGVQAVTWFNWFGAKDPKNENDFFANLAADPATLLEVYPEFVVSPEEVAAWKADRQGALVGKQLAKRKGWKVGDVVTLRGTIFQGDWKFTVRGIYDASKKGVDTSQFFFHYDYLNESFEPGKPARDQVGWVVAKVASADEGPRVSAAIDKLFEDADRQTLTQSELALNRSFMGFFSAILTAINIASIVILAILMLVLGNTIAMGVRERTNEYGVLRAIGFLPQHVGLFVLGEAVTIGILGGALGALGTFAFVNYGLGPFIEENLTGIFPSFHIPISSAVIGFVLAVGLGVVASALPALRASRLSVIDALRRVG